MTKTYNIKLMATKIESLSREAAELKALSGGIQAVDRNVERILASIEMLKMNISDVTDLTERHGSH